MTKKRNIIFVFSVIFIALVLSIIALVRPADDLSFLGNIMYAPLVFFLIFFGTLWVKILIHHLKKPISTKWYVWFFISCLTFWWLGVQLNHYLFFVGLIGYKEVLSNADVFASVDYLLWKIYLSLGGVLIIGIVGLIFNRIFLNRIFVKKEVAFGVLLLCILLVGFLTNHLFRDRI